MPFSLMNTKAQSMFDAPKPPLPSPAPTTPDMRDFGDPKAMRSFIYDDALAAANEFQPLADDRYELRLKDVKYIDPDRYTRKQRKNAVLTGETLSRRMGGTWELYDKPTGKLLESRKQVVARVPYLSSMGTFTFRGNDYSINHQQRLLPGIYARRKKNGELESYVNVMPGQGVSHRYHFDPKRNVFKMNLGQADMPLMPLLRAMGTTDKEFIDAWGPDIYSANYGIDDAATLKKLGDRLLPFMDRGDPDEASRRKKLVATIERMGLDPDVMKSTHGQPFKNLNKDVILAATKKLLALHANDPNVDVDDRDNMAYQRVLGPEDFIAERIRRDHGRLQKQAFKKIALAGTLGKMPSGLFTPQVEQVIIGSGLGQALEEINPAEVFDRQSRITRLGEGGIPSLDAIPDEARNVQPSHMGFLDPLRTPESMRAGIDLHIARRARKGRDGKIYSPFMDQKSGKEVWLSPQQINQGVLTTPDALKWDTNYIPAIRNGKHDYVRKNEVQYVFPHMENAFSALGNLVPIKSAVKGQRVAMASRMLTQALPLRNAEAPLVRGAMPESKERSFEEEYGRHMGAVRADRGGRVVSVDDDEIKLRHDDGTVSTVELYNHHPFNRKTYIHQTATVEPGQTIAPGQLLARSNYTDDKGVTALGLNLRTAYIPWKGYNYEDAVVLSESAAKRLTSEHMYQHDVDVTPKHKMGRSAFINVFPQKYDRETLSKLDSRGVIQVGEAVQFGDPLILAARERDRAQNKIHKQRQPGYVDDSVVWKHHDPGIVTDVVWGKKGPVVLVKSFSSMQVGDKLSGRYGDKGVVAAIVPDRQMPHDEQGQPFEIAVNPLGIQSRTNPAQKAELWLGKIAKLTGKPYTVADFEDIPDVMEYVRGELRKHGVSPYEVLTDPTRQRKIPSIATGHRFYMKLHHTAESKGQGRGTGGYTQEDAPAKGGETGCFTGDAVVYYYEGDDVRGLDIRTIVERRLGLEVPTLRDGKLVRDCISDWFHYQVPPQELVELELATGGGTLRLCATKNHALILKDGTERLAGEIQPGDELME